MTKHIPAPWSAHRRAGERQPHIQVWEIVWAQDGSCIAEIIYGDDNASLITAAPELLTALEAVIGYIPDSVIACHGDKCRKPWCVSCREEEFADAAIEKAQAVKTAARAAIAKAKGETP